MFNELLKRTPILQYSDIVTFYPINLKKCLLKKNCLYIGGEINITKHFQVLSWFKLAADSNINFYLDQPVYKVYVTASNFYLKISLMKEYK